MKKFILLILKFLKKNFHQQKQKKQYLNTFLILEKQLEILTKHKTDYEGDFSRTKHDLFNTWSIDEALDLSFKLLGTKNEIIVMSFYMHLKNLKFKSKLRKPRQVGSSNNF